MKKFYPCFDSILSRDCFVVSLMARLTKIIVNEGHCLAAAKTGIVIFQPYSLLFYLDMSSKIIDQIVPEQGRSERRIWKLNPNYQLLSMHCGTSQFLLVKLGSRALKPTEFCPPQQWRIFSRVRSKLLVSYDGPSLITFVDCIILGDQKCNVWKLKKSPAIFSTSAAAPCLKLVEEINRFTFR